MACNTSTPTMSPKGVAKQLCDVLNPSAWDENASDREGQIRYRRTKYLLLPLCIFRGNISLSRALPRPCARVCWPYTNCSEPEGQIHLREVFFSMMIMG